MQGVEGDVPEHAAARPLGVQHDLGALGLRVGDRPVEGLRRVDECGDVEALGVHPTRGHGQHASAGGERPCQPCGEQERREHVHLERQLVAVTGRGPLVDERAGHVGEHVHGFAAARDPVGERAHVVERGEVGELRDDRGRGRLGFECRDGALELGGVAPHGVHGGAERGETGGEGSADAGRGARDHGDALVEHARRRIVPCEQVSTQQRPGTAEAARHRRLKAGVGRAGERSTGLGERVHGVTCMRVVRRRVQPRMTRETAGCAAAHAALATPEANAARRPSMARSPMRRNARSSRGESRR